MPYVRYPVRRLMIWNIYGDFGVEAKVGTKSAQTKDRNQTHLLNR